MSYDICSADWKGTPTYWSHVRSEQAADQTEKVWGQGPEEGGGEGGRDVMGQQEMLHQQKQQTCANV